MQQTDQTKLQSEVSRSEKAKLVLQEPIFVEAIETLKKLYSQSLLNTGVNEQDAREKLWLAFQIVQKVLLIVEFEQRVFPLSVLEKVLHPMPYY